MTRIKSIPLLIAKLVIILLLCFLSLFIGYLIGSFSPSANQPLILHWIDGKYGSHFYGVEIFAIKEGKKYGVYCKILISPQIGTVKYFQEIGKIGIENNLNEITKKYSYIHVRSVNNDKFLFIGNIKIISMDELEKHR